MWQMKNSEPISQGWWDTTHLKEEGHRYSILKKLTQNFAFVCVEKLALSLSFATSELSPHLALGTLGQITRRFKGQVTDYTLGCFLVLKIVDPWKITYYGWSIYQNIIHQGYRDFKIRCKDTEQNFPFWFGWGTVPVNNHLLPGTLYFLNFEFRTTKMNL